MILKCHRYLCNQVKSRFSCASAKNDARVQAAGFLRGPRARHVCAVLQAKQNIKKSAESHFSPQVGFSIWVRHSCFRRLGVILLTPNYYRNVLQVFRYLEAKSLHDQRKHAIIIEFLQTPSEGLCRNLRILAGFRVTVQIFDFLRAARAVHLLNV